jgi:hypothetical protein
MRTITLSEYNAIDPGRRNVWTTERTDMKDWDQQREKYMGKRTMMSGDGTCSLLIEGLSFVIVDDTPQTPLEWSSLWSAMQANYNAKSDAWTLTTETMFDDMLNVLPPLAMRNGAFLLCEANHHNSDGYPVYAAFRQLPGNVFQSRYMTALEFRSA